MKTTVVTSFITFAVLVTVFDEAGGTESKSIQLLLLNWIILWQYNLKLRLKLFIIYSMYEFKN